MYIAIYWGIWSLMIMAWCPFFQTDPRIAEIEEIVPLGVPVERLQLQFKWSLSLHVISLKTSATEARNCQTSTSGLIWTAGMDPVACTCLKPDVYSHVPAQIWCHFGASRDKTKSFYNKGSFPGEQIPAWFWLRKILQLFVAALRLCGSEILESLRRMVIQKGW